MKRFFGMREGAGKVEKCGKGGWIKNVIYSIIYINSSNYSSLPSPLSYRQKHWVYNAHGKSAATRRHDCQISLAVSSSRLVLAHPSVHLDTASRTHFREAFTMTKRDQKKARSRANARRIGEERAAQIGTVVDIAPRRAEAERLRHKTGLGWLLSKKRITARQAGAGERYGEDYRAVGVDGQEPLRSCLNDEPVGGGGGRMNLTNAEWDIDARRRLDAARDALSHHPDMIDVCDLVCGRQLTPREITVAGEDDVPRKPTQREADKMERTLAIALDLLAECTTLTKKLKCA